MKHKYKFLDWILNMINEHCYGKLSWNIDDKKEYLEFKNQEEARSWGIEHYKNWADKYKRVMQMSKMQLRAVCVLHH